ncbi:zeta toxin family protein [Nocardioides carbamazepini]|jgi:predicted ABC-type ATPase|uniref:AAA family ATPase n=1 Tax=Nocardioides carbamazepini TaxID=2854259 RepID=UPI002149EDCE|nr:AAA family ATPase [Nocardioides carbamazepini]MCR1786344.1 zeta toxin family protein [Nocardioides carbamazepini]
MPVLHLLAGPNGAGKSTYVRDVLTPATALPFINADVIAAERWPSSPAEHAYAAAQIAETERRARMTAGESFITETVFSHPSKVALAADASALGYLVQLHVIIVPVDLTVQRVAERVRRGGHTVPEAKIRERYDRLWDHVAAAITIADQSEVLDNSSPRAPFRSCATYARGIPVSAATWPPWTPEALSKR